MDYFYLEQRENLFNNTNSLGFTQNELILSVILIVLVGYIIYHKCVCKNNRESFMDTEQYNDLVKTMNHIDENSGYKHPQMTPCGY